MDNLGSSLFIVVLLGYLLVAEPLLGRWEMARLKRKLDAGLARARMNVYRRIIVLQWTMLAVFGAWWLALGRSTEEIGLRFSASGGQWIALAVCAAATLAFVIHTHRASGDSKSLATVRSQMGSTMRIAPHTDAELRRFAWVSIAAGVCEEIVYRGLLMTALAALVGAWPAVLLSSVAFGLGHAYQGAAGVVRTGIVGLVLALVVTFTGSLLAAIVMHALLDAVQGRLLLAAVKDDRPEPSATAA